MNNNQLNGLFIDFMPFNPYFDNFCLWNPEVLIGQDF